VESDWEFVLVLNSALGVLEQQQKLGIFPLIKNTHLLNYVKKGQKSSPHERLTSPTFRGLTSENKKKLILILGV